MAPSLVYLPNGQVLTVTPVFGGLFFKANDLNSPHNVFPPGWTIILNCEEDDEEPASEPASETTLPTGDLDPTPRAEAPIHRRHYIHRFRQPSLRHDHLFISSISNPASNDFRPSGSPSRQIAMMLWATLWWYFHQPAPAPQVTTTASSATPLAGRPKSEWRVNINREGIFQGKHLLPKLERMGLIASEDSAVGSDPEDHVDGWTRMFVSRRSFWQLDPRIYLYTFSPAQPGGLFPAISPATSRPASPNRPGHGHSRSLTPTRSAEAGGATATSESHGHPVSGLPVTTSSSQAHTPVHGPFTSGSHLPTYYPPAPVQYTFTNNIRHPIRPKPPRQGEIFYTRYIPSLGQYLSLRVASASSRPCIYRGPVGDASLPSGRDVLRTTSGSTTPATPPTTSAGPGSTDPANRDTRDMTDTELLHKWMNDPRVSRAWGEQGPVSHQAAFLKTNLSSKHSMPVIGLFDGKPFGYFEIYWVREDRLGGYLLGGGDGGIGGVGDYDRGLHVLIGENEFRGPHRVRVWLDALVHYCWLADARTNSVMLEPRVDNEK